jgi:hypothetical protein
MPVTLFFNASRVIGFILFGIPLSFAAFADFFTSLTSKSPASNTFVADVHSIQVLVNPPSQTMLPKKRKTPLHDPTQKSLQKKTQNMKKKKNFLLSFTFSLS